MLPEGRCCFGGQYAVYMVSFPFECDVCKWGFGRVLRLDFPRDDGVVSDGILHQGRRKKGGWKHMAKAGLGTCPDGAGIHFRILCNVGHVRFVSVFSGKESIDQRNRAGGL